MYDFEERAINLGCFGEFYLTNGTYQFVKLVFDLYSSGNEANVVEVFRSLGDQNYKLAMKAIDVRFNRD